MHNSYADECSFMRAPHSDSRYIQACFICSVTICYEAGVERKEFRFNPDILTYFPHERSASRFIDVPESNFVVSAGFTKRERDRGQRDDFGFTLNELGL